jgi:hypothetical protein
MTASSLVAKPGTIKTTDGQTYEGEITEKVETVTITVRGIDMSLPREKVATITYAAAEGYEKEFADKLAKLDKKDVKGRLDLARDAFTNKKYELARQAADEALTIDPNSADAASMRDNVQSQMRLERAAHHDSAAPEKIPTTSRTTIDRNNFLTPADINQIRLLEMKPNEQLQIRFEKGVQKRFVAANNLVLSEYTKKPVMEQALEIIEHGTPDMRDDVKIMQDPAALMEFRRVIEPLVLKNCATSNCHGGPAPAGGFMLYNVNEADPSPHYTNFYILQSYTKKSEKAAGIFEGGDLKMLNRTQPSNSLLVQYALPQNIAEHDHPEVGGYKGIVRNQQDPRYKQLVDWLGTTLKAVEPQYTIKLKMPGAATQPATAPAVRK